MIKETVKEIGCHECGVNKGHLAGSRPTAGNRLVVWTADNKDDGTGSTEG